MISAWWLLPAFLAGASCATIGLYWYGARRVTRAFDQGFSQMWEAIEKYWGPYD